MAGLEEAAALEPAILAASSTQYPNGDGSSRIDTNARSLNARHFMSKLDQRLSYGFKNPRIIFAA
jgi:hypothetical protein